MRSEAAVAGTSQTSLIWSFDTWNQFVFHVNIWLDHIMYPLWAPGFRSCDGLEKNNIQSLLMLSVFSNTHKSLSKPMEKFVLCESLFKNATVKALWMLWTIRPQIMAHTGLQRETKYYEVYSNDSAAAQTEGRMGATITWNVWDWKEISLILSVSPWD